MKDGLPADTFMAIWAVKSRAELFVEIDPDNEALGRCLKEVLQIELEYDTLDRMDPDYSVADERLYQEIARIHREILQKQFLASDRGRISKTQDEQMCYTN